MAAPRPRRFTGWHMTAILLAFFGTVMAVNFAMARFALATFGGIVVENSYVASQEFNRWLDAAESQRALGWDAVTTWRPDDRLVIAVSGAPEGLDVAATARHPLGRLPDRALSFTPIASHLYLSDQQLPPGRWTLRLQLRDSANEWRREEALR